MPERIQAADTQLGMMDNYGDGTIKDQYPNIGWEKASPGMVTVVKEKCNCLSVTLMYFYVNL